MLCEVCCVSDDAANLDVGMMAAAGAHGELLRRQDDVVDVKASDVVAIDVDSEMPDPETVTETVAEPDTVREWVEDPKAVVLTFQTRDGMQDAIFHRRPLGLRFTNSLPLMVTHVGLEYTGIVQTSWVVTHINGDTVASTSQFRDAVSELPERTDSESPSGRAARSPPRKESLKESSSRRVTPSVSKTSTAGSKRHVPDDHSFLEVSLKAKAGSAEHKTWDMASKYCRMK
mmetsp:Transcript_9640/g.17895  ORF Transcript_9640/g.17895 Transcript_9640/m.17895 type:complete len:230 (+) Transcript_9640:63-752(+)